MIDPARLELSDLAAQTMILPLYGSSATDVSADQRAANTSIYGYGTPAEVLAELRPGGVVLLQRMPFHPQFAELPLGSLGESARLQDFVAGLQSVAEQHELGPLIIIADQEGGEVNRLPGPTLAAPAHIGDTNRVELAERAGYITGVAAREHGVNLILGPVADIALDGPSKGPIGDRSFGSDPQRVATMVAATVQGLHHAGVAATAKHWPGHGRANADSHVQLPSLDITKQDWLEAEAQPFRAAVDSGVDAILAAHLVATAIDDKKTPASMSGPAMELLDEIGFHGMRMTDALWMPGIRQQPLTDAEIALTALAAGADCLLATPDPAGLRSLAANRDDLRPRLEMAATRIQALRDRFVDHTVDTPSGEDWVELTSELNSDIAAFQP